MTVKSDLEVHYASTPSTIRSLCEYWKMSNYDLSNYLHGAFMFLSPLNEGIVEKELDFLCKIVRIR
jgi:hypothetical protein